MGAPPGPFVGGHTALLRDRKRNHLLIIGWHCNQPYIESEREMRGTIDLYWVPLGAGGHFVAFNGRLYEYIQAKREHRQPSDLYHTALEIRVPEGRYIIENAWPIPDRCPAARGVTVEGPVWAKALGRLRVFRYEVRRWRDGLIPDIVAAVESPYHVSGDEDQARRVLELAAEVPRYVWGRDEMHLGEMWNSNSVISWLLTRAGIRAAEIPPPKGGRAPGWMTGVRAAVIAS